MEKISPSKVSCFHRCDAQFYHRYVLKTPSMTEAGKYPFLAGCVVDDEVKEYYKEIREYTFDEIFSRKLDYCNAEALFVDIDPKKQVTINMFKERCASAGKYVCEVLDANSKTMLNANNELDIGMFHSYPDNVFETNDGKIELLDIKFTTNPLTWSSVLKYRFQLEFNRFIWNKLHPKDRVTQVSILNGVVYGNYPKKHIDGWMVQQRFLIPDTEFVYDEQFWDKWLSAHYDAIMNTVENGPKLYQGATTGQCGFCGYRRKCMLTQGYIWDEDTEKSYLETADKILALKGMR